MLKDKRRYFFLDVIVKISLAIFLVATLTLIFVMLFVFASYDGSYEDFIRSQLITQKNIQLAMLMSGLFLIMVTTLITWLIGLYASFKVAGPLFRFSENISRLMEKKDGRNIRKDDCFQELSVSMLKAIDKMDSHKQELKLNIDRYSKLMAGSNGENKKDELLKSLCCLKDVESRIKLSD